MQAMPYRADDPMPIPASWQKYWTTEDFTSFFRIKPDQLQVLKHAIRKHIRSHGSVFLNINNGQGRMHKEQCIELLFQDFSELVQPSLPTAIDAAAEQHWVVDKLYTQVHRAYDIQQRKQQSQRQSSANVAAPLKHEVPAVPFIAETEPTLIDDEPTVLQPQSPVADSSDRTTAPSSILSVSSVSSHSSPHPSLASRHHPNDVTFTDRLSDAVRLSTSRHSSIGSTPAPNTSRPVEAGSHQLRPSSTNISQVQPDARKTNAASPTKMTPLKRLRMLDEVTPSDTQSPGLKNRLRRLDAAACENLAIVVHFDVGITELWIPGFELMPTDDAFPGNLGWGALKVALRRALSGAGITRATDEAHVLFFKGAGGRELRLETFAQWVQAVSWRAGAGAGDTEAVLELVVRREAVAPDAASDGDGDGDADITYD